MHKHRQSPVLNLEDALSQAREYALFGAIRILLTKVGEDLWVVEAWSDD